jgi:hypothetical protein
MMTGIVDSLVSEAIQAHRAGNNTEAEDLLRRAIELDDNHEMAWLWMSAVVESTEDRIKCLEFVIEINPNNDNARRGLNRLRAEQAKHSPFLDVNVDELGDIDAATQDFMADLSKPESTYRTGYESDFDNAILDIEEDEEEFDPLGDFDALGDDDDSHNDHYGSSSSSYYADDDENIFAEQSFSTYNDDSTSFTDFDDDDDGEDAFADYKSSDTSSSYSSFDDFNEFDEEEDPFGEYNDEPALDHYFMMIPSSIRPTRVPGSDDSSPTMLILIIVILFVGNIGLGALLLSNMIA